MIQNTFTDIWVDESYSGGEPVTLADAKAKCRVDFTDDDSLISALITAARQAIENFCHISLVQKTITVTLEASEELRSNYAQPFQVRQNFNDIELPYGPIRSVSSVTSIDSDGVSVINCTLNSDYFITGAGFKRIKILNNFTNNILVYTAGYGTSVGTIPGPVPQALKEAIFQEIAYRYENRGDAENIRASAFTDPGVCEPARVLASPYKRLAWL